MFLFALLKTKDPGLYKIALAHIETVLKKEDIYSMLMYPVKHLFRMFEAKECLIEEELSMYWEVGGCLADDMGLGKTVQALSAILLY